MHGTTIPAVLKVKGYTAISTERALKQIKRLLEESSTDGEHWFTDAVNASLDDVDVMLEAIDCS
jgi:hypothetical protein